MTRPFILVEDSDHKANPVMKMAQMVGYSPILRAKTLVEGLDLIDRYRGVVLTDWCFPIRNGREAQDGMGMRIVFVAQELGLPVRVLSNRDFPAEGYEEIWFDAASSVTGLMAWLEEEVNRA